MSDLVSIRLKDQELEVPHLITVGEVLKQHLPNPPLPILAALVHRRCVDLTHPICSPTTITPVDYSMREGVLVYRRTVSMILFEAARMLFPGIRVSIGQSLGNGYFYEIHNHPDFTPKEVVALQKRMREIVELDLPITPEMMSIDEARQLFRDQGLDDKVRLLKTWWEPFVPLVKLGTLYDIQHYPSAPTTSCVKWWDIMHYPPGMVLRFPARGRNPTLRPFQDAPKLFATYHETRRWNKIVGVENVGQLNEMIVSGEAGEVVRISEALHEKKIAKISESIAQLKDQVKLILIAGPSASGKTTFSKRLSLMLIASGLRPVALSMDNFYVNRADTPKDDKGNYDFESIEAIDLTLFNEVLHKLLKGEEVLTPRFDFTVGMRRPMDKWIPMRLLPGQVLMAEGIHGLNERLTPAVPNEMKYKIYVSALSQLCIDDHNRIFTSDTRFLRRIVRDRRYRNYSAASTIENWGSVRRGEMRNIFPFQEQADVMFNSALIYEQSVLRPFAERYLLEVPPEHPSFTDAYRLLKFISNFVPLAEDAVPQISILREFMGGSAFKY